jgi:type III restriction enzyme
MPAVIENPVINSPYEEPRRHFVFGRDGITNEIGEGRRESTFFIPIAPTRRKEAQLDLDSFMTSDRMQPNDLINRIRREVGTWRHGGRIGVTPTTRRLIEHWTEADRERRLFFCQVEAAETAIFIGEVASRAGVSWIDKELRALNAAHNGDLFRLAFKIATGGGKTLVMAMLIAWQSLNKAANRQDRRFSNRFLVVTPGITVRDRLRVLKPSDPENVYRDMEIVPDDLMPQLQSATVELTNYHAFHRQEKVQAAALTKKLLTRGRNTGAFTETSDEMVNRVCRSFGSSKAGVVVINDEAHHCYYRKREDAIEEVLSAEEKKEAAERGKAAEAWISGLEAIRSKRGIKVVYDLSATPFFLKGSGFAEGTLFPWVASDFALIDAIEAGIVKIPRVPVVDNRGVGDMPTYRNLWLSIRNQLPKGTRAAADDEGEPILPDDLAAALQTLYEDYERTNEQWELDTPPVFIIVCNNTRVSKRIFDYVAGWANTLDSGSVRWVPGQLPLFSNVADHGVLKTRPTSMLIDSVEIDSGELSAGFRKVAAQELEEFKAHYRQRSGKDPEQITEAELLREVLNTVGKAGKLGSDIRCVVSVSMLAEGWDATTVTHILGVRAFGTQLLCEQVVGRALRRFSYVPNDEGRFDPEYAEVYGVPFAFIPTAATKSLAKKIGVIPNHVMTVPDRTGYRIEYPRVIGYRYDVPAEHIRAEFKAEHRMNLTTEHVVTKVELDPVVGVSDIHTLETLRSVRMQTVVFGLARRVLEDYFRDAEGHPKVWIFPQLVEIARRWIDECLTCSSETYPQLLLLHNQCGKAAGRINQAIVQTLGGETVIQPILADPFPIGATDNVSFDTVKPVVDVSKSHLNRMVLDSNWEGKVGQVLEEMPQVIAWVKNDRIGPDRKGLRIPYSDSGRQADYIPDFIVRVRTAEEAATTTLLVEVTGERRDAKLAKAGTALNLWLPAVNHWARLGQWDYVQIHDPWMAKDEVHAAIHSLAKQAEHV